MTNSKIRLPDLTFASLEYGQHEPPYDLKTLLYRGGSAAHGKKVGALIAKGQLGSAIPERVGLVTKIHECLNAKIVAGGSRRSLATNLKRIREFFAWAEINGHSVTLKSVQVTYLAWCEMLLNRVRVEKSIKMITAQDSSARVGAILDFVLSRTSKIVELTNIPRAKVRRVALERDKQNLQQTFQFGHFLQDICDGLSMDTIWGPLPARIPLRQGDELEEWSGLTKPENVRALNGRLKVNRPSAIRTAQLRVQLGRKLYEENRTLKTRFPLVNLRVEAELMMFIAQTGMNLSQAYALRLKQFSYHSTIDGYRIRDYKARRHGEVLFEIYHAYRKHFERYLEWRREVYPKSNKLFPFTDRGRAEHRPPCFGTLRLRCKLKGITFVGPKQLRHTRVNWLLRQSGDPELTADMAQHTVAVLESNYDRPSMQRLVGEQLRFWQNMDPALKTQSVAPGECDGSPVSISLVPKQAVKPDCIHPAGCLWCEHHRDVDSLDYVWALVCFRHLKIIEVSKYRPPISENQRHPGEQVIHRISDKLKWFRESNSLRNRWVDEVLLRVEEGHYHPDWWRLIEKVEGAVA